GFGDGAGAVGAAPGYTASLVSLVTYPRGIFLKIDGLRQGVLCRVIGEGLIDICFLELFGVQEPARGKPQGNLVKDAGSAAGASDQEIAAREDDQQDNKTAAAEKPEQGEDDAEKAASASSAAGETTTSPSTRVITAVVAVVIRIVDHSNGRHRRFF